MFLWHGLRSESLGHQRDDFVWKQQNLSLPINSYLWQQRPATTKGIFIASDQKFKLFWTCRVNWLNYRSRRRCQMNRIRRKCNCFSLWSSLKIQRSWRMDENKPDNKKLVIQKCRLLMKSWSVRARKSDVYLVSCVQIVGFVEQIINNIHFSACSLHRVGVLNLLNLIIFRQQQLRGLGKLCLLQVATSSHSRA